MAEFRKNVSGVRIVLKPMGAGLVLLAFVGITALALTGRHAAVADTTNVPQLAANSRGEAATGSSGTSALALGPLLPTALDSWAFDANAPAQATKEILTDPAVPNLEKRYVRAHITSVDPQAYWAVQFKHPIDHVIPNNTLLVLRFIARSATRNQIHAVFLLNSGDYPKDLDATVDLTPEWKVYTCPFTTKRAYQSGEAAVLLHLGEATGDIELAALQVYSADHVPAS